jgi:hypothetical protein
MVFDFLPVWHVLGYACPGGGFDGLLDGGVTEFSPGSGLGCCSFLYYVAYLVRKESSNILDLEWSNLKLKSILLVRVGDCFMWPYLFLL